MSHIRAEVFAGAGEERMEKVADDKFRVWVREESRNNLANRRVLELMARTCGVESGKIKIVKGHKSSRKIFEIRQ